MIGANFLKRILPTPRERRQRQPLVRIWIDAFAPNSTRRAVMIEADWVRGGVRPKSVANAQEKME